MFTERDRIPHTRLIVAASVVALGAACGQPAPRPPAEEAPAVAAVNPMRDFGITANNAFWYYDDVERANAFYTETLGIDLVADYGFAKILRPATTSYLILVDAEMGMHSTDEPKSVVLSLVTDQLNDWHEYLTSQDVEFQVPFEPADDRPYDAFVVLDPEGILRGVRTVQRARRERAAVAAARTARLTVPTRRSEGAIAPSELGVKATVLWLYYDDLPGIQRFYEDRFGFELTVDQGWAKIYRTSPAGYVGLVDGARGMRDATEQKAE